MTMAALAAIDASWTANGDRPTSIAGISYSSGRTLNGDLFVALRGGYVDGHDFAAAAVEAGATALMVEHPLHLGVPEVIVPDARAALAQVAAEFYGHPSRKLTTVGITGTDGKTTTSHVLDAILRDAGKRTGMIGTIAVTIDREIVEDETRQTTPESLDVQRHLASMVDRGVDVAIVEATSHGLDLHRLDAVAFDIAGVTNITHEHLEHHKTISAYRRAKAILFEKVADGRGVAVVNRDDEGAREMIPYATRSRVFTFGFETPVDFGAEAVEFGVNGSRFELVASGRRWPVRLPMLGEYNVSNALCAVGMAHSLGIGLDQIAESLERVPGVPGRMERIDCGQPFAVIVDYAHTPESLRKVLALLRALNSRGRLIVVSGSAGERDPSKRSIQGSVCADLADFSIFTTEDPRFESPESIIDGIAAGASAHGAVEGRDFVCITDRMTAVREAVGRATPGDVVLLAGKGHERSIIWGQAKQPWNESASARTALYDLGFGGEP